jgi:3-oxoacyl-[acyl-carrier-protein] synthase II
VNDRQVVVTAMGVRSCFSGGVAGLAAGLLSGRTGLAPAASFDGPAFGVQAVGEVADPRFDQSEAWSHLEGDRKAQLLLAALSDLLQGDHGEGGAESLVEGVWIGTGLSSVIPQELEEDVVPFVANGAIDRQKVYAEIDSNRLAPNRHLPERAMAALAKQLGCNGPQYTSFSACAAGAQAIAEAFRAVRRGDVDVALCGGQDAMIHPLGVLSFTLLGALSPSFCRPFDQRRDGFSLGEGAALLVLEEAEHARSRGAQVLAQVLGAGSSVDAFRPTAPHVDGRGAVLSMTRALRDADLSPHQVNHINAHGTGTPVGDAAEIKAIVEVFGVGQSVSSIKGAIGHCVAAAGAMEAAACVLALREGFYLGTVGCEQPENWPVQIEQSVRVEQPEIILSNSMGFGGQNCSLIFGRAS